MVGLFIGLLVALMSLTYVASSTHTFRIHTEYGTIQENARYALSSILRSVNQSWRYANLPAEGFVAPSSDQLTPLWGGSECHQAAPADDQGRFACSIDGKDSANHFSDRLTLRSIHRADQESRSIKFCNGKEIRLQPHSRLLVNSHFWVADIDADGVASLYCRVFLEHNSVWEGPAVPLIDGVESLQFRFGSDTDGDGLIDGYRTWNTSMSQPIKMLEVAILLNGAMATSKIRASDHRQQDYTLLERKLSFNDGRLRAVFSTALRLHDLVTVHDS